MLFQRIGEDMSATAVRHEIERVGPCRVQHRPYRRQAGVGYRPFGQARHRIGVIAVDGRDL